MNKENYLISIATGMIDVKNSIIPLSQDDLDRIKEYEEEIEELESQGKPAIFYVPDDYDI